MQEQQFEENEQNLLNEKLSSEELQFVLRQLGESQFGGGEESRIRDIAEATGADPYAIGQVLADLRKENFEQKYGLKIKEHEARIENLEEKAELPAVQTPSNTQIQPVAKRNKLAKALIVTAIILVPIILAFLALAMFFVVPVQSTHIDLSSPTTTTREINVDGVYVSGPTGGPYKANDHGKYRPATEKEAKAMKASERTVP